MQEAVLCLCLNNLIIYMVLHRINLFLQIFIQTCALFASYGALDSAEQSELF